MDYIYSGLRYARSLGNSLLGVEGFTEDASGNTVVDPRAIGRVAGLVGLYALVVLIITIAVSFGAARQSYCYNIYIGNTEGVAILFAILCFFFPGVYYPFYALFLNPVCSIGKKNKGILGSLIGGKKY